MVVTVILHQSQCEALSEFSDCPYETAQTNRAFTSVISEPRDLLETPFSCKVAIENLAER